MLALIGDDDRRISELDELRIDHDAAYSAVAVRKGVDGFKLGVKPL